MEGMSIASHLIRKLSNKHNSHNVQADWTEKKIDEYDRKAIRDFSKRKRAQQEAFHWSRRGCFVDSALDDAVRIIVAAAPAKSPTPTTDPTTRPAMVPVERLSSASLSS
jgi:hypothetical protein